MTPAQFKHFQRIVLEEGPDFPGIVCNLIYALRAYRRWLVEMTDCTPRDLATEAHLADVERVLEWLIGWDFSRFGPEMDDPS